MLGVGACGGEPQLTIILRRGEGVPDQQFIKLDFATLESDPDKPNVAGPFAVEAIPTNLFEQIPPGTQFSVDVAGCQTADAEQCTPDTFTARGCTENFIQVAKEDNQRVDITLEKALDGAAHCPTARP